MEIVLKADMIMALKRLLDMNMDMQGLEGYGL